MNHFSNNGEKDTEALLVAKRDISHYISESLIACHKFSNHYYGLKEAEKKTRRNNDAYYIAHSWYLLLKGLLRK